jgi:tRNA(adenine34) deaminase
MLSIFSDEYFMSRAYQQAQIAFDQGEIPVGAVLVCKNQIIARTHNQTELLTDVTAHAEILAITAAAQHLGSKYLNDCRLYVTLEPCPMCAGALAWAQLGKLVYGAADSKRGFMKYGKDMLHPKTQVAFGVMETQCQELLTRFFKTLRK